MAEFSSGYYSSMDRDYEHVDPPSRKRSALFSVKDIGTSTPPFKDQLESLKARIKQGTSTIELGFTGVGKGSMGGSSTNPEMVPKWQRQAIKDLAKINDLSISTHASVGIGSLAGFTQQGFSEEAREKAINEIKRAVEFAADTTEGGPIVAHLGEFPRSIYEEFNKEGFRGYENEDEHAVVRLVDKRTGELAGGLTRSTQIPWPVFKTDAKGEQILDETGRPIPEFDEEKGMFKTQMVGWEFFEKQAIKEGKDVPTFFYHAHLDQQEYQASGMAKYWSEGYGKMEKQLTELKEAKKYYEEIFEKVSPEDRKNWKKVVGRGGDPFGILPDEKMDPLEWLESSIKQVRLGMEHRRETGLSYSQQIIQIQAKKENTVTMEEFALKKTANTVARAAEFAMAKSKGLKEALFIAPENVFAEQYGSHPQELKRVILASRDAFVEQMKKKGMSEGQARKAATKHIRATFDVGHANTWKKYYYGNPKKSYEQNEKDFKKWLIDQVKDLNKHDIIGHVHVSDNFGYEDEHVTPGQGIAPIKEFLEEMKKAGAKKIIVEPGHQDYLAMYGGWREFGGSIYGSQMPTMPKRSWSDVEFSYFGQTRSPYFVFGEYSPSQDWTLWTGVPLE